MIFEGRDKIGTVQIAETKSRIRSLHFDSRAKQSAADMNEPFRLNLEYSRAMMMSLLFVKRLERVLSLGLGGGSIPKFLYRHFADCTVDVVESRKLVIDLAYRFFELPRDKRVRVFHQHAEDFLEKCQKNRYDLIFVDLFGKSGISSAVADRRFAESLQSAVDSSGVVVLNLWTRPKLTYRNIRNDLLIRFDKRVLDLPIAERINCVLFAFNATDTKFDDKQMEKKARLFEKAFGIDFPLFARELIKCNRALVRKSVG